MKKHHELLKRIRERKGQGLRFGQGIWTADRYVSSVMECVGPGVCSRYFGSSGKTPISQVVKAAGEKLSYAGPQLVIDKRTGNLSEMEKLFGAELPAHSMVAFRHVLTTPREDRDLDTLRTEGAIPDPKMPLLWQHIHTLPIGKAIKIIEHTPLVLRMASVLLDINDLTSDAAKLIEADALRFSHGFRALEFEERHKGMGSGFDILKYEIMEESLVSVPSNIDAELELWSAGKLKSQVFKSHARHFRDLTKKVQVQGVTFRERLGDYEREIKVSSFSDLKQAADAGLLGGKPRGESSADAGANASLSGTSAAVKTSCECGGTKEVYDKTELFENEIDARTRAGAIGCTTIHKVGDQWAPCRDAAELQSKVGHGKGTKEVADQADVFESKLEAESRAEVLGCIGCHEVNGKYMPCRDAAEYEHYRRPENQPDAGDPDITGKRVSAFDAAAILLASDDLSLLERTAKAIATLLKVHQSARKGDQFRKLFQRR